MASTISAGTTSATALNMSADTSGVLQLASNNGTVGLTLDTSQNVGIGTSSPSGKLEVAGANCLVKNTATSGYAGFYVNGATGNAGYYFFAVNGTETARISADATNTLSFATGSSATERARIDSSGNLLVGATSFSGSGLSLSSPNASGCYSVIATGGTGFHWRFGNVSNGIVGSISTSTTATTYSTSSDYRLKNTITPMTGALAKVAQLKPVTYKWNADGSDGEGFIAHELSEICPHAVTGEKDAVDAEGNPQYQGIDTSFLVATLTAAIQELNAKVTSLEEQVLNLGVK